MFRDTFWTPYDEYKSKIGEKFNIIRELNDDEYDKEEVGQMWKIKLEDNTEVDVFEEEILTTEALDKSRGERE